MKYFLTRWKRYGKPLLQGTLIFGVALLVLLYFLGYYDFSFLDRYVLFGWADGVQSGAPSQDGTESSGADAPGTPPSEGSTDPGQSSAPSTDGEGKPNPTATDTVRKIYDCGDLADALIPLATVEKARAQGYVIADPTAEYAAGESILAKVTFSFQLPRTKIARMGTRDVFTIVTPVDGSEPYAAWSTEPAEIPSVQLYMGYLLLHVGEDTILIDSHGTPLCRYKNGRYEPAYERDGEGRPLFCRETEDGMMYFYISEDGASFVGTAFDPATHGRGLAFDYPADYGVSDTDVTAVLDEETGLYFYGVLNGAGEVVQRITEPLYVTAYPFAEGLAAVTMEENRGNQFYISRYGFKAFDLCRTYLNEYDRYAIDFLLPPLTRGLENLGFYYFDEGLVRVRRQALDYWNYSANNLVKVVEEHDVLVRTNGTEYVLPIGYDLRGYSDGRILLEKNGRFGFLSVEGEWIAQPIFADAIPFIGGLAALQTPDGRWGMIDKSGQIALPFTYDHMTQVSDGLIATYREENGWAIYRIMERAGAGAETESNTEVETAEPWPAVTEEAWPEPATEVEVETEPETEPETEMEVESETEPEPETESEAEPETESETEPETEPETPAETEPEVVPEVAPAANAAVALTDHLIRHVMTEDWMAGKTSFTAAEIQEFLTSLCFAGNPHHPYLNMLTVSESGFLLSFEDANRISEELFSTSGWGFDIPSETGANGQQYVLSGVAGAREHTFSYELLSIRTKNDFLYVDVILKSVPRTEEEDAHQYGYYIFQYEWIETDYGGYLEFTSIT